MCAGTSIAVIDNVIVFQDALIPSRRAYLGISTVAPISDEGRRLLSLNREQAVRVCLLFFLFLLAGAVQGAAEAVYQYAVPVAHRTAYLWLPPTCAKVRGVLVSFANLTERQWLEDPLIRTTSAEECLGGLWIGPGDETLLSADLKPGAAEILLAMFRDLARQSGFQELEWAPVIPMGHSAHGHFAWRFAQLFPERTIAAIPIKTIPLPAELNLPGIPLLYVVGETTEWPQYRDGRPGDRDFFWPEVRDSARTLRSANPENLIAVATEPGGGHFDWSENQARLVALFIREACTYRLPSHTTDHGPVPLLPIHAKDGWLTDSMGVQPDRWPAAPAGTCRGDLGQSYWFFDRTMARAAAAFSGDRIQRRKQMLTFRQDGKLLPVAAQGFAALRFEPEADGITFHLTPDFLPSVPVGLIGAGTALGHADGSIELNVLTGPAIQISRYEFRVDLHRGSMGGDLWIEERQPGDGAYRKAVQPGKMLIPTRLTEGSPQSIRFDPITDQRSTTVSVPLHATSSSGLPVRFYVDYGPAGVVGNNLVLREVPRFAKRLIEIRVVAYQWGRPPDATSSHAVQSAEPVTRTFFLMP